MTSDLRGHSGLQTTEANIFNPGRVRGSLHISWGLPVDIYRPFSSEMEVGVGLGGPAGGGGCSSRPAHASTLQHAAEIASAGDGCCY